ncbi:alpha/beta fold hydrolase [Actinomadura alba]|uniref:Alpha/beta fold hydrolase n=1 Tax=Actinomadura alba TaxID=406431 RepID=A0ABR7LVM1_9ACTN|nr:alpha/beta hydrolase [Actinomadura alba]MBC6468904.1 alpha/beta fold hydrolase [Actinomadura alba]
MPAFTSDDATKLAYHVEGEGPVLVCLPGGPGRASRYLGDLGGLTRHRTLIRLDGRGSGESARPADPATYRCDRLVADVEALRVHLGLERMDLLAHSAAGDLAVLYAARHPERLRRLVLVTPALSAVGVEETEEEWHAALERMSDRPWYADAREAMTAWDSGDDSPAVRLRAAPFLYGQWDDAALAHARGGFEERAPAAAEGFYTEGAFAPEETRAALSRLTAPVLVVVGELDAGPTPNQAAELAAFFPEGWLIAQAGVAHFPWVTRPAAFAATVEDFLAWDPLA